MKRLIAALLTAGLLAAVPAQAASPMTVAKRAALAKAERIAHVTTGRIKGIRLVGPGKRYEVGALAGDCTVFMYVTVVGQKATKVQVTGKDCLAPPPPPPPTS